MAANHNPAQPEVAAGTHDHIHPGFALLVIAGAQLMIVLDATIVNIALPSIQRALDFSATEPLLGPERVHARLRRPAAAGRPQRRPLRPPADVHHRHPDLRWREPGRRVRDDRGLAADLPGPAGRRRSDRVADRPGAGDEHVPGGSGAEPRVRRLRGGLRRRRRNRADPRRRADGVPVVAVGAVRERADRRGARHRDPLRAAGEQADHGPPGPARGHHVHGRRVEPGVRPDPRGIRRLERHVDARCPGPVGRDDRRLPLHRGEQPAAADAAAPVLQPQPGRELRRDAGHGRGAVQHVLLPDAVRAGDPRLQPDPGRVRVPAR